METRTYWKDNENGKFQGGFFIRSDLHKNIKHFEDKGYRVIGIKVDDSWNLEFICEVPKQNDASKQEGVQE